MSSRSRILVLVGAQYGSEGKGSIAHTLARNFDIHVRTGGPNAGHTFFHEGEPHVMQSLPCGWTNRSALLVIGAGAVIEPGLLLKEIERVRAFDPNIDKRVYIDSRATIITEAQRHREGGVDGELHRVIGSTGKGVGAARIDRLHRDPIVCQLADTVAEFKPYLTDTVRLLSRARQAGLSILLEGTQGSGLSLTHGPWPYVTTEDTNAAQLAAAAGIPPHYVTDVVLVARTMPIRVAGNSGPMYNETTWDEVSTRLGRQVTERTTVTKKTRRIGAWDDDLFARAVELNGPTSVAITFLDYLDAADYGVTRWSYLSDMSQQWIRCLERNHNVRVGCVSTGPLPEHTFAPDPE